MTPTIKRYDEHPYDTTFTATVLSVAPGKTRATLDVILDETLFFPEEGGQTPDRGTLAGYPVIDVQIRKDVITHTIDISGAESGEEVPAALADAATVEGILDWSHRYSNMQNHSGEHILSGIMHSLYGYDNVGFRLSDNTVTLDTSGPLTDEQVLDVERRANAVVWSNVPITCEYPAPEVVAGMEYRSKKAIDGAIRIVTIEGVDVCACCAPHVRRTGEIGLIKILDAVHYKSGMRLTIVCGSRALAEMQTYQSALTEISHLTKVPREETPAAVVHLQEEISALKESARTAQLRYIETRLAAIDAQERSQDIWILEGAMDPLAQRTFMNALCDRGYRYAGVFCGDDETGWKYLIGSRGGDARVPNKVLQEHFHARGGGKPEMVQGSLTADHTELLATLHSVIE